MERRIRSLVAGSALALSACSSLHVRPLNHEDARGIPFYLPRQDFVIEELGFDDGGKWVGGEGRQVSLVRGADESRAWRVANAPHWLADSKFTLERQGNGVLKSVTGDAKDQIVPTVTQLAAVATAVARALDAGELAAQRAAEQALIAELSNVSRGGGAKERRIKEIEQALGLVRARIAELEAAGKKKAGTRVSRRTLIQPIPMDSMADVDADLKGKPMAKEEVRVYVVPVQPRAQR